MRIALVCDYALDYLGGAQTALLEEAAALAAAGHEVLLVAPGAGASAPAGVAGLGIAHRATLPGIGLPLVRGSRALRARLRAELVARDVELVHTHSEFGVCAAAARVAGELGIRHVHTVHTLFWRSGLPRAAQRMLAPLVAGFHRAITGERPAPGRLEGDPVDEALRRMSLTAASRAQLVISPSEHQRRLLVAAGLTSVVQLANTVELPERRPSALEGAWGPLRVVWAGRCTREKGLRDFALGAMAALDVLGPRALRVEIVGDGPELAGVRRLVRGHPAIVVAGRRPHDETMRRMARAHLVALTSHGFDNQPMVVAEACWAARGVLHVDPALREGLATAGALCEEPGPEGIAALLVELARDRDRVVALSRRARDAFAEFSRERHVSALERAYGVDAPLARAA